VSESAPEQLAPHGKDLNDIVRELGWKFPTWMDPELHEKEFSGEQGPRNIIAMFRELHRRLMQDDLPPTIIFKHWRYLSEKATKMKPCELKATLYIHPEYANFWMYVEAA